MDNLENPLIQYTNMKKKYYEDYLNPSLAVDIVVFTIEDNSLKVLTIERDNDPFKGLPALPGGFVREGENTEMAAVRILKDKAGVSNVYIEQLYTFDELGRDPRGPVFSVTYFALAPREKILNLDSKEYSENSRVQKTKPHFISTAKLPKMAFDHNKILNYSIERLQSKLEYTNVSYSLLGNEFTFTELQNVYETILNKKMDKRNFRKKILQLGLIEETDKISKGGRQRPARLYKFKTRKLQSLQKFF